MTEVIPLTTDWTRIKLRVEDYLMLDQNGAFDAYGRTELIEGEIVYMNAQHRPHARVRSRLFRLLADALDRLDMSLEALVEGSVSMPPHNVPEPDIAVTCEPDGSGLIPLESLVLVIEVADTTLTNDLGRKATVYAQARVPEYWVVDINAGLIHQMWSPTGEDYAESRRVALGADLTAATIPDLTIATDGL